MCTYVLRRNRHVRLKNLLRAVLDVVVFFFVFFSLSRFLPNFPLFFVFFQCGGCNTHAEMYAGKIGQN